MTGKTTARGTPYFKVRRSRVHGRGAFALRSIRKSTRLIEYVGDRVSHQEADERYEDRDARDNHTFLFIVDARTVIDAGVDGNDARYINHSCKPNCYSWIKKGVIWIRAARNILPGEELTYDYYTDGEQIIDCRCRPGCTRRL